MTYFKILDVLLIVYTCNDFYSPYPRAVRSFIRPMLHEKRNIKGLNNSWYSNQKSIFA